MKRILLVISAVQGKRLSLINFRAKEAFGLKIDPLMDKICLQIHEGMQSTEQLLKPETVYVLINMSLGKEFQIVVLLILFLRY